jgi:hypothetical protein
VFKIKALGSLFISLLNGCYCSTHKGIRVEKEHGSLSQKYYIKRDAFRHLIRYINIE